MLLERYGSLSGLPDPRPPNSSCHAPIRPQNRDGSSRDSFGPDEHATDKPSPTLMLVL